MFINGINFGGMNSSIHVGWVVLLSTQKRRNIVRDGKKVPNFKLEVQHEVKKKVPKLIGTIREK